MRARHVLVVVTLVSACLPVQAEATAVTSCRDFLRQWVQALTTGNLDAITSFYEDSEEVIVILSTGHVRAGHDAIRREYEAALREVVFEDVSFQVLKIREADGVAWATGRFKALTRRKSDRSRWKLEIYTSLVLKRKDKGWWIVSEQSTAIDGVPRVQRRT